MTTTWATVVLSYHVVVRRKTAAVVECLEGRGHGKLECQWGGGWRGRWIEEWKWRGEWSGLWLFLPPRNG